MIINMNHAVVLSIYCMTGILVDILLIACCTQCSNT